MDEWLDFILTKLATVLAILAVIIFLVGLGLGWLLFG